MSKMSFENHIMKQFDEELEEVRTRLMEMGGKVEQQLQNAVRAVTEADSALAELVIKEEKYVDEMEVDIDEACILIIARRQPAASDLRLVMMVTKAVNDLERIGDEAQKIAKVALEDFSPKQKDLLLNLDNLGHRVLGFLQVTLDAFARMDDEAAIKIHSTDSKIDREYEALMRQLMTYMMEDPRSIPQIMSVIWSARALERIGDRCQNICEYIIYLVKGKVVRHATSEDMKKL